MSVQGPLARRVRDVQLGLRAMAARDARDPWWAPAPHDGPPSPRPIRVALTVDPSGQGVHPDVAAAVRAAGAALSEAGYAVEVVDPPDVAGVAETWRALIGVETGHAMLAAIRQHGDADVVRCTELLLEEGDGPGLGGYLKLLAQRSTHLRRWLLFLEGYPLVVGPVSTEPPFVVGFDVESVERTREVMVAQRLLVAVNLLGLPAASVPTGLWSGVPLGVQVIGSRYREDLCLEAAEVIEAQRGLPTPIDPVR
jgi:amidase